MQGSIESVGELFPLRGSCKYLYEIGFQDSLEIPMSRQQKSKQLNAKEIHGSGKNSCHAIGGIKIGGSLFLSLCPGCGLKLFYTLL